jgi:hypothetical protein
VEPGKNNLFIKKYEERDKDEWNAFLSEAKNGLFIFDRDYMDYHKDRYFDHSVIVKQGGRIVALFPASQRKMEIYSHEGLTFGGLLMDHKSGALDVLQILEYLAGYYRGAGQDRIVYKAIPYIFHKYPATEDQYALHRMGARIYKRELSTVIDLSEPSIAAKSNLRKAEQCGALGIEVLETDNFNAFWTLLSGVLDERYNASPVHSIGEIALLNARFPDQIRLFGAWQHGELLAGTVIYDYGKGVRTQYMANSKEGRQVRALDFIILHLINKVYYKRNFFSFGTSSISEGRHVNEGLIRHKEMMGGRGVLIDTYLLDLNP